MFDDTGTVPGEEPSSHLHPEAEGLPRPGCHSQGEMGNVVCRSLPTRMRAEAIMTS